MWPVAVARVLVINLDSRPDRWQLCRARWSGRGLPELTRFAAVARPDDPARGCLASHLQALQSCDGPVLILEDDAIPSPRWRWPVTAPAGWRVLWLGGQHRRPSPAAAPGWRHVTDLVRTHAYIAARPRELAAAMAGAPRIDPHLAAVPVAQYALDPFTVGQAAGRSDITGLTRRYATFWNTDKE